MKRLLLIRHTSPLRQIAESEVVDSLSGDDQRLDRAHIEVAMGQFADSVEQGDWTGHDQYLREWAGKIRGKANEFADVALHYFGLAEVPHIIALGAHVGDERTVAVHDYDRDAGVWGWSTEAQTVSLETQGEAELNSVVKARGAAVIRVAISAVIADADVREVVGDATLADVTITHKELSSPTVTRVRSAADVEAVRREFRRVFGLLRNTRPNVDLIHLFVAGPPSVCFVVGQELTLRNSPPIQLYRYRKSTERASQQPAILLTTTGEERVLRPLTEEEMKTAAWIRNTVWPNALRDLKNYAANRRRAQTAGGFWFSGMEPKELEAAQPFPALPPLTKFMPENATVDPEPFFADYGFEKTSAKWRLGDRLLLGLGRCVDANEDQLRALIRLFLFHEYLHDYHTITKHTAQEVGKFANCLEYLDYMADTYAILHQLDLARYYDSSLLDDPAKARQFIKDQIELAIRSFWAFDEGTGSNWQVRRVRRYLNWYWRFVQIENAPDLKTTMRLFRKQPHLEIGGLHQVVRGRRVFALLDRLDASTHLELGIVLENDRLHRVSDSPNANLAALLRAFTAGEHSAIKEFFRSVYDSAAATDGVQPKV